MKSLFKILPYLLLTMCAPRVGVGQILMQESFDGNSWPSSWNRASNDAEWNRVNSGGGGVINHSGAGMAEFRESNLVSSLLSIILPTNTSIIVSPAIDFSAHSGGSNVVSVWVYRTNKKLANADKLDILINTSSTLTGATTLGTIHRSKNLSPIADGTGWQQYSFEVPASFSNATNAYLLIKGTYAGGEKIYMDDVTVSHCNSSVSATVSNVTCSGSENGSIDITVNNATTPISYEWTNEYGAFEWTEDVTNLPAGTYGVKTVDALGCQAANAYTLSQPMILSFTAIVTSVACNAVSGDIVTTPTGGTPPYTYAWTGPNSFTANTKDIQAPPGLYTLVLTDANGCTSHGSYTIGQAIGVSGTLTHNVCYGGSTGAIALAMNGGTPPYTIAWNNNAPNIDNISGLAAGAYSVTVTDPNNCLGTGTFIINEPTEISVIDTIKHVSCFGGANGSINLGVSGGTPPYLFDWNISNSTKNRLNLSAGTYEVTITDANLCTKSFSFTVTQPELLTASNTKTDILCSGSNTGSIDVNVYGGTTPYTYVWSGSPHNTQDRTNLTAGTYAVSITDAKGCNVSTTATLTEPTALFISYSKTNILCNGANTGAIDITVSGGVAPYTYSWSNGQTTEDVSELPAGHYTITVTDANGCAKTTSATVAQPPALTLTGNTTQVNCFGGTNGKIDINVNGGVSPYIYSWSNNATTQDIQNLAAGSYTIAVTDANGCATQQSYTVSEPPLLSVSGAVTDILCNGANTGAINLTAIGGTPDKGSYEFTWNNGSHSQNRTGLGSGTYSVTVEDKKHCTATASFTLSEPAPVAINPTITNVLCNGANTGAIDLGVSGGVAPYTYLWDNNGGTSANRGNLSAGTYSVTVTDANNCAHNRTYTIAQAAAMSLNKNITGVSCNGGSNGSIVISVSGGSAPYSHQWNNNSGNSFISGLAAGTYTVTVTDANQCTINGTYTISEPSAIYATMTSSSPTCAGGSNGSLKVAVTGGVTPYTYMWNTGGTTDARSGLTAGNYTVTITDANGCTKTSTSALAEPPAISTTASVTNVSCKGSSNGAIILTSTGGIGVHTYRWSNNSTTKNISSLIGGSYTVTVTDANGCTKSSTFTVVEPTILSVTTAYTMATCVTCTNGAVNATVSGGTSPYTFLWSNSATTEDLTGVGHGTYSITVTDSKGCTASKSGYVAIASSNLAGTVTMTPLYPVSPGGAASTIYLGYGPSTVTLGVSGNLGVPPYTYSWTGTNLTSATRSVSPTTTTTYTVQIKDATNTVITKSYTVKVVDPRDGSKKMFVCHNGNNTLSISVNAVPAHLGHGDYLGPCTSTGSARVIHEEHEEAPIKLYPNPSTGMFTLEVPFEGDKVDILITDLQGKVIVRKSVQENWEPKQQFDLRNIAKGVYLIYAKTEHQTFNKKLFIQ